MAKSTPRTHPWIRGLDRHFLTGTLVCTNGAVAAGKGPGFSVAYVEEGVYTLTFTEKIRELIGVSFGLQSEDALGGSIIVVDPTDIDVSSITIRSFAPSVEIVEDTGVIQTITPTMVAADIIGTLYFSVEHRETGQEER